MNIREYTEKTLNNKAILNLTADKQIYFVHAIKPKCPYVEFEVLSEYGVNFAEGEEQVTRYLIQVDIFSKNNYNKIEQAIKKIFKENEFIRTQAADLYEQETKLFHKAMRFTIDMPCEI